MPLKEKGEGFCLALEHVQSIYERLYLKNRLCETCKGCHLMEELNKLLEMAKGKRFEMIEKEIGYYLR